MTRLSLSTGGPLTLRDAPPLRGGEACVYEATDARGARVAVKVALVPLPGGAWLDRERALLCSLALGPAAAHVVEVLGEGLWDDRPFFAMPWYPDTLERRAAGLDPAGRRALCAAVADAVAALHAAGVVHGDLKPSNVLVDPDGHPRLADLGAARKDGATTTTATVLVTRGFSAPEAALPGARPTQAGDAYGLAATVLFALTGSAPRPPALTSEGRRALALGAPVPFERAYAALERPRSGIAVLDGMLEPDPARRRGTPADLARALREAPRAGRRWPLGLALGGLAAAAWAEAPVVPAYPTVRVGALEVGEAEVTQATWRDLLGEDLAAERRTYEEDAVGPSCAAYRGAPLAGDELPAVCVDWYDAVRLANAMSAATGLPPAYRVTPRPGAVGPEVAWDAASPGWRLPTSEEWVALAGPAVDPCGRENVLDRAFAAFFPGAHGDVRCDDGAITTRPAGPPNALGVRDALGNVSEWAWDEVSGDRATAGASWASPPEGAGPTARNHLPPTSRLTTVGVRLVRAAR